MIPPRDLDDEIVTYLNSRGYHPILVGRGGLIPPAIYQLTSGNTFKYYGQLADILLHEHPALNVPLEPAVTLTQHITKKKSGKASLGFAGALTKLFGSRVEGKLDAGGGAHDETFIRFGMMKVRSVPPSRIDEALTDVDHAKFKKVLNGDKTHIAYEYLYAHEISAYFGDGSQSNVDAEADLSGIASFKTELAYKKLSGEGMSYSDKENPVAIAFRLGVVTLQGDSFNFKYEEPLGMGFLPHHGSPRRYIAKTGQVFRITF